MARVRHRAEERFRVKGELKISLRFTEKEWPLAKAPVAPTDGGNARTRLFARRDELILLAIEIDGNLDAERRKEMANRCKRYLQSEEKRVQFSFHARFQRF